MSFGTYSAYRDSNVAWIGQLPMHWEVISSRRLFDECREPSLPEDEQLSATQRYGVIPQRLFMETEDHKVVLALSGTSNFKRVQKDDFVISLRSFQGGIEHSNYEGCVSPAYTVLRPNRPVVSKYWAYTLKCVAYISALQTVTAGIRDGKNISYSQFGGLEVPMPPLIEQRLIADALDRETAKIDALIAEQEKLLNLLAEKRQANISHAVTRGLDPNASMKHSGVEWLGEVPAHWDVDRFKASIVAAKNGIWGADAVGDSSDIPCVRVADFDRRKLTVNAVVPTLRSVTANERQGRVLQKGDLLLEKSGGGEAQPVGQVVLYDCNLPAVCSNFVARVEIKAGMDPRYWRFVHAAAYSVRLNMRSVKQTSGIQNLDQGQYFEERAPFPPAEEQRMIADVLDQSTTMLDALEDEGRNAIRLLQERRSALVAAAVTGKIDVRGLVEPRGA